MRPRSKFFLTLAVLTLLIPLGLWFQGRRAPAPTPAHLAQPAPTDARPESPSTASTPPVSVPTPATAHSTAKASPAPAAPTPVAATAAPAASPTSASSGTPGAPATHADKRESPEVTATRRMYGAHASLRSPELADPDSETNRRVLQTMVEKALSRQNPAR